ncbi:mitochondrial carrier domain-containing protein [Lineolata rhizophorae]|uniref:Mitochondrial carrier domain-containing protein n=1 Tax=Lineolata rhizophorae TaxID=578093 RepID=A0A6A6P628_9PEZI|nr:mitochondrial carrier domain-containing protein [Lineolata rhizophorae]
MSSSTNGDADLGPPAEASVTQKMLSAVSGSVLTSLLVTPLDVVRVRLQSQHHTPAPPSPAIRSFRAHTTAPFTNLPPSLGISSCCREVFWVTNNAPYCVAGTNVALVNNATTQAASDCAAEETRRKNFTSTLDGLRKIARNEGARTLWRGLSPTLLMAVPANVIYFAGYDWLRISPTSPLSTHNASRDGAFISDTYAPLAAGSSARIVAAIAVSPIEMFRTRLQAQQQAHSGHVFRDTLRGLADMVRTDGVRALWRGLTLTLWRDVPFSAIYWWGYEGGRDMLAEGRGRLAEQHSDHELSRTHSRSYSRSRADQDNATTLVDSFVAGAASGAVAALVTTPFDVGKTRQQVIRHGGESAEAGAEAAAARGAAARPEKLSMPRFLAHIFKEQGMAGLFRGWAARCLKVAPACAIMISSYEVGKKMAGGMNKRREAKLTH